MRVTPDNIKKLNKNQVFVFGSNESGIHGAGAARIALLNFGAKEGLGFGYSGQSFAIPTKSWFIETLPLWMVEFYVNRFTQYAKLVPEKEFFVTQIGCGLAGYLPYQIAPMFARCLHMENVWLPQTFIDFLMKNGHLKDVEDGRIDRLEADARLQNL